MRAKELKRWMKEQPVVVKRADTNEIEMVAMTPDVTLRILDSASERQDLKKSLRDLLSQNRLNITPRRQAVLDYLSGGREAPMAEISKALDVPMSNLSRSLYTMVNAGVIERVQRGAQKLYRIP